MWIRVHSSENVKQRYHRANPTLHADMSVYLPSDPALPVRLAQQDPLLVICYCAAWCDTCKEYRPKLESLAQTQPDTVFVWVDIEDSPELLDDEDVENFPTILLERSGQTLFFGTVLPHIGQLERLIQAVRQAHSEPFEGAAPRDIQTKLLDLQS